MKVVTSVLVGSLSGAAGDVVAASWKGRLYCRRRVVPANPNTAGQQSQRAAFARCVDCYQNLPADIKTALDTLGSDEALSGYNIMMRASVKDERDNHGHVIVPDNRYAATVQDFVAATGAGLTKEVDVTWSAGDYIAEDLLDIYYRKKQAAGDEYETPWTQYDTAAMDMADEAATLTMPEASQAYQFAMVPYDTSAEAFGGGAFNDATSKV